LDAICYFPNHHYAVHTCGIKHNHIPDLNSNQWFFHDGYLNSGKLIKEIPKLKYYMKKKNDLPDILLYKSVQCPSMSYIIEKILSGDSLEISKYI